MALVHINRDCKTNDPSFQAFGVPVGFGFEGSWGGGITSALSQGHQTLYPQTPDDKSKHSDHRIRTTGAGKSFLLNLGPSGY